MRARSFGALIKQHDRNLAGLQSTRRMLAGHAQALADLLVDEYPVSAGVRCYWGRGGDSSVEGSTAHIARIFDHTDTTAFYGDQRVFDPWNGFWRGNWCSSRGVWPQYHIWDQTRPVHRGASFVQPVSQRALGNISVCTDPGDPNSNLSSDYVDDGTLERRWRRSEVNLAINVWTDAAKVTGWVWKKQGQNELIMPHLGYRLNAHTLIWIAQEMPFTGRRATYTMNPDGRFFMFFEWVGQCRQTYGIHGREFTIAGLTAPASQQTPRSRPIGSTTRYVLDRGIANVRRQECSAEPQNFCLTN
ncbi:MAG: hypothetical protein AAFV19_14875 [Pseudomonadota bacterium]